MSSSTKTLICGAGIAGISVAYHLAVQHGMKDIMLVDERPPLSLTSSKSTECYRNWWPGPGNAMVSLMNHSIDLMEQYASNSGNIFHLNRRGYLYLTAQPEKVPQLIQDAKESSLLGAGSLRIHRGFNEDPLYIPAPDEGFTNTPSGTDLLLSPKLIQKHFPYLPENIVAATHVRRAGWLSAQQLGMYLLEQARLHGVELVHARLTDIQVSAGRVQSINLSTGVSLPVRNFIDAAGPFAKQIGNMLGLELPISTQLHLKVAFHDLLGVLPRSAPLLIWSDSQYLPWNAQERSFLTQDQDTHWLLENMPPGAHIRPEGGPDSDIMLLLWEYQTHDMAPIIPPPLDDLYPEIALRGMAAILPQFEKYFHRIPKPMLDGGYYTRTPENRPLIGPLPIKGAYIIGALSGYGLMSACGAGDLLATHITGGPLPVYAPAFSLSRYQDPKYQDLLKNWPSDGQL